MTQVAIRVWLVLLGPLLLLMYLADGVRIGLKLGIALFLADMRQGWRLG